MSDETSTSNDDSGDLQILGYKQELNRTMGSFASFAVAFSMISITNAVFFLFSIPFTTIGGIGIWIFVPVLIGVGLIALTYAHVGARIPLTGYAYQWNSRIINRQYGFASGWTALLAFFAGTASIGTALAAVFAPIIWESPSRAQLIAFAGVMVFIAAALNIISIRATSFVNNLGVSFEIVGSLVAALILLIGVLFFFKDTAGFSILFSHDIGQAQGAALSISGIGAAALLPIYTLLGWEGAADLAEETVDPRKVTPKAMIRANWTSTVVAFVMIAIFAAAIPHGVADMLAQTENPLIYIFRSHFGDIAAGILEVIVFVAIFSCLLANMAVATRMTFSLARDNMLPGSSVLSIVNVCYYATYALTLGAVLWAAPRGRIPHGLAGGFTLGRWLRPVATIGMLFSLIVVANMVIPESGHTALIYFLGAEAIGLLWFLLVLRGRLRDGTAGPSLAPLHGETGAGGSAP
jgi:amino acid transporter